MLRRVLHDAVDLDSDKNLVEDDGYTVTSPSEGDSERLMQIS